MKINYYPSNLIHCRCCLMYTTLLEFFKTYPNHPWHPNHVHSIPPSLSTSWRATCKFANFPQSPAIDITTGAMGLTAFLGPLREAISPRGISWDEYVRDDRRGDSLPSAEALRLCSLRYIEGVDFSPLAWQYH